MFIESISQVIYYVGTVIAYIGILAIIASVIFAVVHIIIDPKKREKVRGEFARNIMFGLEFIIAADILVVTVAKDLTDILQLGGIVIIRILLGYALRKEVLGKHKQ